MLGVTLDFCGASQMTLDQHAHSDRHVWNSGSEEQRLAGDHLFRLPHVRHDGFGRLAGAGAQSRQRQRSSHDFQKLSPARRIVFPFRRLPWEFTLQQFLKAFGIGKLFERAPVLAATASIEARANGCQIEIRICLARCGHRWHVEQLVRLWMLYSFTSFLPSSSWLAGGV